MLAEPFGRLMSHFLRNNKELLVGLTEEDLFFAEYLVGIKEWEDMPDEIRMKKDPLVYLSDEQVHDLRARGLETSEVPRL
jgi:hypothetical protein